LDSDSDGRIFVCRRSGTGEESGILILIFYAAANTCILWSRHIVDRYSWTPEIRRSQILDCD
jgi:hypothetical protein